MKFVSGSRFKYVSRVSASGKLYWKAAIYSRGKVVNSKLFATEREAAICVDKHFINQGKEPVNVLKRQ